MNAGVKLPQRKHPRLSLEIYREGHVFFTTLCTHDRYRWFERYPELTRQAVATLLELSKDRGAVVYAWSVLPDHLHLLVQDDDLVQFVRLFKGRMTPLARLENRLHGQSAAPCEGRREMNSGHGAPVSRPGQRRGALGTLVPDPHLSGVEGRASPLRQYRGRVRGRHPPLIAQRVQPGHFMRLRLFLILGVCSPPGARRTYSCRALQASGFFLRASSTPPSS